MLYSKNMNIELMLTWWTSHIR